MKTFLTLIPFLFCASLLFGTRVRAQDSWDFTNSPTAVSCEASESDCKAYLCLENKMNCGEKGYLKKFGFKNCEKYLASESFVSDSLKEWYPRVRRCLQDRAIEIVDQKESENLSCGDLKKKAFESHVGCYVDTGFCDLGFFAKLELASVTGTDLFKKESLEAESQINEICLNH